MMSIKNTDVSKNKFFAVIAYTARVIVLMFASGTLIQTLLGSLGFDSRMVYIHSSLIQAANIITVMLCPRAANGKGKTVIRRSAFTAIPMGILFLTYIPLLSAQDNSLRAFTCFAIIGALQQVFVALFTIFEYKIPYYVYRAEEYGRMLAICGIVSSLASLLTGAIVSAMSTKYSYSAVMSVGFAVCFLLMAVFLVTTLLQKDVNAEEQKEETGKAPRLRDLLRYPVFASLIPANLFRGFSAGSIGVLAATAIALGYGTTLTSTMVVIQSVASLVSCACFAMKPRQLTYKMTLILGSVMVATTPLLLLKGEYLFLALYAVIIFGRTLIDYATPSMLRDLVPVDMAASFNAWRMVIHNAGTMLATVLATLISVHALLIATAICQLLSGVMYYLQSPKKN